jgi:hypothetical protein
LGANTIRHCPRDRGGDQSTVDDVSLSFHSAVAIPRYRSPRRVHWGETLRILSGIREKKKGWDMHQLTRLSRRNRSALAARHPIEEKNHPVAPHHLLLHNTRQMTFPKNGIVPENN